jgi:hypothetical protein
MLGLDLIQTKIQAVEAVEAVAAEAAVIVLEAVHLSVVVVANQGHVRQHQQHHHQTRKC